MYYLKTKNIIAKAIIGFCFILLITTSIANGQNYNVKNYRQIRGMTNPAELMEDFAVKDAGAYIRQMMFSMQLGIFEKDENGNINPNQEMSNLDTIKALSHLQDPDVKDQNLTDAQYRNKAIELEFITQEELRLPENNDYYERTTTAREFYTYLSQILGKEVKYRQNTDYKILKKDIAQGIYDNKEQILNGTDTMILSGISQTKGQIQEENKSKTVVTVKLDRIYKLPVSEKETQVHNVIPKPEEEVDASFVNIVSDNDVVILTPQGLTTNMNNITLGSKMNIYYKDGQIMYIEQFSVPIGYQVGILKNWNITQYTDNQMDAQLATEEEQSEQNKNYTSTIEIVDYNGQLKIYAVHPNVSILQVNGELGSNGIEKPISTEQLTFGQDVQLQTVNNIVTTIKGYVPVEEELNSYIPPMSRLVNGVIIDYGQDYLTLSDSSQYQISPNTLIMKNSVMTGTNAIKHGDIAKLYFDDIYSNTPSKIEIEGTQRQVDKIIKAKVGPYSNIKKSLTLRDVYQLVDGRWVAVEDIESDASSNPDKYPYQPYEQVANNTLNSRQTKKYENIKIAGDIYANSQKVPANNLKNFNQQEIYAVLSGNQGIPTIKKAQIRIGDGLSYNNIVTNIDHSQNSLRIDGNLVTFDDSTIVVKDGNLITTGNIETNLNSKIETNLHKSAQLIVQDGSGYNITKTTDFPYKIYRATIRDVYEDSILLGNDIEKGRKVNHYFMLQGGVWNRLSETATTPRLRFTENTLIYDFENDKVVTVDQMKEQQYAFNAFGVRPSYFNRQVYAITKDDLLVGLIYHDNEGYVQVNSQNMITAKAVGAYTQQQAQQQEGEAGQGQQQGEEKAIKNLLIRNISQYNSMTNTLEPINPIVTTDPNTQKVVQTPVRKLINTDKAIVIDSGRAIPKTSVDQLKDKYITVIFKQDRSKQMDKQGDMEILNAICVIAH